MRNVPVFSNVAPCALSTRPPLAEHQFTPVVETRVARRWQGRILGGEVARERRTVVDRAGAHDPAPALVHQPAAIGDQAPREHREAAAVEQFGQVLGFVDRHGAGVVEDIAVGQAVDDAHSAAIEEHAAVVGVVVFLDLDRTIADEGRNLVTHDAAGDGEGEPVDGQVGGRCRRPHADLGAQAEGVGHQRPVFGLLDQMQERRRGSAFGLEIELRVETLGAGIVEPGDELPAGAAGGLGRDRHLSETLAGQPAPGRCGRRRISRCRSSRPGSGRCRGR